MAIVWVPVSRSPFAVTWSIASEDARFGLPEVGLGIIPAAGGTQTVPRAVGNGSALEMMLTNRWIDAAEALRIGLVNRVVSRDRLFAEAEETADRIAAHDPKIIRFAKEAVLRGLDLSLGSGSGTGKKAGIADQSVNLASAEENDKGTCKLIQSGVKVKKP